MSDIAVQPELIALERPQMENFLRRSHTIDLAATAVLAATEHLDFAGEQETVKVTETFDEAAKEVVATAERIVADEWDHLRAAVDKAHGAK